MAETALPALAPSPAELERKLHALRALPARCRAAVRGLTDAQLDEPLRKGGWSSRQVVHHLANAHMHALLRMKALLHENHPTLKPWDQDVWEATDDERLGPVEPSLRILEGVHARMADLLARLRPADWGRTGWHPEDARVLTLRSLLDTYEGHGPHHVEAIEALRRARGW
ncbi:MAG TPA: DinB family protein [Planctomycetota bacterium]|nr:DinB family protein [Planctomycetota bacterium]